MTKVKICGITNKEDAFWAYNLGADFIGLNFCKNSLRKVSLENATNIINSLKTRYTSFVGVFLDHNINDIVKTCKKLNIDYVQLHGNESVEYCFDLKSKLNNIKIIKVFKIPKEGQILNNGIENIAKKIFDNIKMYIETIDYLLFDTLVDLQSGGSGEVCYLPILKNIVNLLEYENIKINYFIAGGLTIDNVEEIIKLFKPWGVDVASGVESSIRRKDFEKMKNFIRKVKSTL